MATDYFCSNTSVFSRSRNEEWGDADWENARGVIRDVLEPAPKCKNTNYRVHTGHLKKPQWIHDNGGSVIPKHCCHRCLVTDGAEHGPLCERLPPSGAWRGTLEQKEAVEYEFDIKISDDANLFHTNHWMPFQSTNDPDDEERKLMVTEKVHYPGMSHYFPDQFASVATQIGAVREPLNTVYSCQYFDRNSPLHQPSVEQWGSAMNGAVARAMPPTFTWGIVGYVNRTQRVVRAITTEFGWIKNGVEAEQVQVQNLDATANGTFFLQTIKREFRGRPVGSGWCSYTITPWGSLPNFWDSGAEARVGVQVLEKCIQPNKKKDADSWYKEMVAEAQSNASSSPFRSLGTRLTKVERSEIQLRRNEKVGKEQVGLVDEEDEEEAKKFAEMHEAALKKRAALEEKRFAEGGVERPEEQGGAEAGVLDEEKNGVACCQDNH